MKTQIMVVDDEKEIADLVELYLVNENYVVHKCYSAGEALIYLENEIPDLVILDVMLPETDGFTVCREIRKKFNFPVIMLTAKSDDLDKINGLSIGADDYITKPFNPLELVARVKAQLRRFTKYNHEAPSSETIIVFSGLILNKETHECCLNEKQLNLTPIEFSILWILCENRGQVISSEKLFQEVWGEKYYNGSNNTVMVHIRHLREKMSEPAGNPKLITTVWGVGYKIEK